MKRRRYFLLPDTAHTRNVVGEHETSDIERRPLHAVAAWYVDLDTRRASVSNTSTGVATPPLPREREPCHRLHEPDHVTGTVDPVTGHDIGDLQAHPTVEDGKLAIYFESGEPRAEYERMSLNHPCEHAPGDLPAGSVRGG
jgi:hypothetical protein